MGGRLLADDFQTGSDSLVLEEVGSKPGRTLVLLGRIGNGKKATGNSILGETKFLSQARGKSITKQCALQTSVLRNGVTVNVIDTPGLFSASSTTEFTSGEIVRCLGLAKDGIDAVLLVFSILFGCRIVDYIIIVFTNADALKVGETLEDYLEDCPEFQGILKECSDRKVLFDNRCEISESKKDEQVQDLLNLVEQISKKNNGKSYMTDLSLELRLKKELEKSYKKMLKEMEEKVSKHLKESLREVKEKLSKAEAAREESEKKLKEIQKLSLDEIRELREQLAKAVEDTDSLRAKLDKKCTIL
ncbi:unnamed protein product [Arabis nemorensis]|uniref:AIG1-type G domain-containing protein n=1 Tax=Arabis nemorensis TaxID=586526 RepID=A0A565C513_9BRAS|nr:unnamed protein product [Arabis nemorensis]